MLATAGNLLLKVNGHKEYSVLEVATFLKHKSEHDIQSQIMIEVSKHNYTIFRTNVGKVKMTDGRYFDTGLPKGHPDLYGFRHDNGKLFYIEVKDYRGKPRPDQVKFHEFLTRFRVIHGIARSPEDALKIIDNELVGYGY